MIKPTVGQLVSIHAIDIKPGMIIHRNDEKQTVFEVEIELTEARAVFVGYKDQAGKAWGGDYRVFDVVKVEYKPGQNIINIL